MRITRILARLANWTCFFCSASNPDNAGACTSCGI